MSTEENKALARRVIEEGYSKGNLAVIDEIFAADFIDHDPELGLTGNREGFKQAIRAIRDVFPDIRGKLEDSIAEGDKVVERWTVTGTHQGEFMGIPPTGKQISMPTIVITRFSGGKAVERWSAHDMLGMVEQLGVKVLPNQ